MHKRDSSYSSSSDDLIDRMKNMGKHPRVPLLFEGVGAIPVHPKIDESSNTGENVTNTDR